MRILVLNYEYPPVGGGAGTFTKALAEHLSSCGHSLSVITMRWGNLPEHEIHGRLEIWRVPGYRKNSSSCTPAEQFSYLREAARFLDDHPEIREADVCHCHFIIPDGELALYLKRKYGIPYVLTAHGSDVEGYNRRMIYRMLHLPLRPFSAGIRREAAQIAVPSRFLESLIRKRDPKLRCVLIPNAVVTPETEQEVPKEHLILLMGRMQPDKNFETALAGIAGAVETLRNNPGSGAAGRSGKWEIAVLGDGPRRRALEELVRESGISGQTSFYGWIGRDDPMKQEVLMKAALYISASRYENSPMSVLEAAANGCTLLLSDIPAHREMMGDEAVYFPANDASMLKERLIPLLRQEPERRQYSLERYSFDSVCAQYEDLLKEAACGRS